MRIALPSLARLLQNNVAEIKFVRRNPKPGKPASRRMLCTNSGDLLTSTKGRMALNFKPTYNPPEYNPAQKNLIITWDIFMQGYRTINMDSCELISSIPANDQFWNYFTEELTNMTAQEKIAFMDV